MQLSQQVNGLGREIILTVFIKCILSYKQSSDKIERNGIICPAMSSNVHGATSHHLRLHRSMHLVIRIVTTDTTR